MIKNVFYDLDGTLLPMDMETFTKTYFSLICKETAPLGFTSEQTVNAVKNGTVCMVLNDGSKSNEEAFWESFCKELSVDRSIQKVFDNFYDTEFDKAKEVCGFNPFVPIIYKEVKEMGLKQVLATNPIFPPTATRKRTLWAGLKVEDFEYWTTYDNSHYCKPNPMYYRELLDKLGMKAEETIMIGNDAVEDVAAAKLGIKVFLISDCLYNPKNVDYSSVPSGDFRQALEYIKQEIKK